MDIHNFRYAEDALRFWGGTPSPAPFILASAAHNILDKDGIIKAQNYVKSILTELVDSVPEDILVSPPNGQTRGGTLVIAPRDRKKLTTILTKNDILFDERPQGFRFSFHHYTPRPDIDTLISILRENTI